MGIRIKEPSLNRKLVMQLVDGETFTHGGRYYIKTVDEPYCLETGCLWAGAIDETVELVELELRRK